VRPAHNLVAESSRIVAEAASKATGKGMAPGVTEEAFKEAWSALHEAAQTLLKEAELAKLGRVPTEQEIARYEAKQEKKRRKREEATAQLAAPPAPAPAPAPPPLPPPPTTTTPVVLSDAPPPAPPKKKAKKSDDGQAASAPPASTPVPAPRSCCASGRVGEEGR